MKKPLLITLVAVIAAGVGVYGFMLLSDRSVQRDQDFATQDAIGQYFMTAHPGAYNKEFTNNNSIHLSTVFADGQTNLALTIPRDGDSASYRLRCENLSDDTIYFELVGKSDKMATVIENKSCFNKKKRTKISD